MLANGYACDRRGRFSAATESTRELGHRYFHKITKGQVMKRWSIFAAAVLR